MERQRVGAMTTSNQNKAFSACSKLHPNSERKLVQGGSRNSRCHPGEEFCRAAEAQISASAYLYAACVDGQTAVLVSYQLSEISPLTECESGSGGVVSAAEGWWSVFVSVPASHLQGRHQELSNHQKLFAMRNYQPQRFPNEGSLFFNLLHINSHS